ncbi:MAG: DUF192 domain-containing protein [Desulfonatronovibrio sp.]
MNRIVVLFCFNCLVCIILCSPVQIVAGNIHAPENDLPRILLEINEHQIEVEVAANEALNTGLMFRTYLPVNEGMLFVFEPPRRTGMWMKNTLIPLSVAFLNKDGVILNIERMEPLTRKLHFSSGVAAFALEMNQGWFEENNIKPRDIVRGLDYIAGF